jgi:hypothetical protein
MRPKTDGPRESAMEQRFSALVGAVGKLYYAAYWTPDRECEADLLWEKVRDAAGFAPGHLAEVLGPRRKTDAAQ